jgi:hypothetical protein
MAAKACHLHLVQNGVSTSDKEHFGAVGHPTDFIPAEFADTCGFFSQLENLTQLHLQRQLTCQLEERRSRTLLDSLPVVDRARLWHLSNRNAAAWRGYVYISLFTVLPLNDTQYSLANKFCLGLAPAEGLTRCDCGADLDLLPGHEKYDPGHHQSCIKQRKCARNSAHDLLNAKFCELCNRCFVSCTREAKVSGTNKRPDAAAQFPTGVMLTDTTIRHGTTLTALKNKTAGTVKLLNAAVRTKVLKYATDKLEPDPDNEGTFISKPSLAKAEHASFMALAMTTYGDMHKDVCSFLRMLTTEAVTHGVCQYADRGRFYSAMVAEISTQVMKGNAWTATRHMRLARMATEAAAKAKRRAELRLAAAPAGEVLA